jgi:hypothetical protein
MPTNVIQKKNKKELTQSSTDLPAGRQGSTELHRVRRKNITSVALCVTKKELSQRRHRFTQSYNRNKLP